MAFKYVLSVIICLFITTIFSDDKDYLKMIRRDPIKGMKNWIICDTCKHAMKSINRRARAMRDALKHEELEEEHYFNITKYACQPYHDHGDWITKLDIVKKGKNMKLIQKDVYGRCSHECETIALACQAIIDTFVEEIPEYLYSKISTAKLQKKICKDACNKKKKKKKPKIKDDWGSEEFQEIADDQRQMFRSFVMGELHKREQPKDDQQDYLQKYAEAYIDQEETAKKQKAAKRKYDNKMRARKGLPPLPEEDEEEENKEEGNDGDESEKDDENENANGNGDGESDKNDNENSEDIKTDL